MRTLEQIKVKAKEIGDSYDMGDEIDHNLNVLLNYIEHEPTELEKAALAVRESLYSANNSNDERSYLFSTKRTKALVNMILEEE